ncbi:MAG TPA: molybdate ABC transporter substrate-binding protein [Burkholderiaceae bacterium]
MLKSLSFATILTLVGTLLASAATPAAELTVSAASSLTQAFREVAAGFEAARPGTKVLLNFAASDALLAQIAKGAPVDLFASADQETMDKAAARNLLRAGSRQTFAGNQLVLITPFEGGLSLTKLADLQGVNVKRIAMGQPESVPAGRYARRALQALWPQLQTKIIYAQNVRQALDYVARGEVDAGLVYATDARAQAAKVKVRFSVPTETPISYPAAVIAGTREPELAQAFIAYLQSPAGQALLAGQGFVAP